jgi:uncharacterized membrane protein YfcA
MPVEYVLVVVGGLLAGALNVIAAGGAVLSFLVLTWVGLPPHVANATNLVATPASFLGALAGAWRDRREYARRWPLLLAAGWARSWACWGSAWSRRWGSARWCRCCWRCRP